MVNRRKEAEAVAKGTLTATKNVIKTESLAD